MFQFSHSACILSQKLPPHGHRKFRVIYFNSEFILYYVKLGAPVRVTGTDSNMVSSPLVRLHGSAKSRITRSSSSAEQTQILIYRYLIQQKTNQFIQKIVLESEKLIQDIFHANCFMSYPVTSQDTSGAHKRSASRDGAKGASSTASPTDKYILHFTYYNAEDRQYHTDMILDGTRKLELCRSKEYHQVECIDATKGTYLMFSCAGRATGRTRIKLFQLKTRASGEFEMVPLRDFGRVLWYSYVGGPQKKLVFLVNQQREDKTTLLPNNGVGPSAADETRMHHLSSNNSAVKLEAFSLNLAPQKIPSLYSYSLLLSHVPCKKHRNNKKLSSLHPAGSVDINPAHVQPLLFPPSNLHLYNSDAFLWTKYQILSLDNGTEVLCRCYQHPNDSPHGHFVRVTLFVFRRENKHKYSFKLRLNENKVDPSSTSDDFASIKNHITFISQGSLVVIFVSGQYLKLVDCSEHNAGMHPQSLLTIQLTSDAKDFLPTVPHIDDGQSGVCGSEFPFVVQILPNQEHRASKSKSSSSAAPQSTLLLNLSNGRLYNMTMNRSEVSRFLIQQQRGFVPLMHLAVIHLHDEVLAKQILRNACLDSELFLDAIGVFQEYIVSRAFERAQEQGLSADFLALLPKSLLFESHSSTNSAGSEHAHCNLYVDLAREKQKYPHGLKEWQPLWLEGADSPASNGANPSPKVMLSLLDFASQNHLGAGTPRSAASGTKISNFFKNLLQLQNKEDLLKRIEDPFAMSQRWLFFVCLKTAALERLLQNAGDSSTTPTNSGTSGTTQKKYTPLFSKCCKEFTRIIAQVIDEVFQVLKSTKEMSQERHTETSDNATRLGYFRSLELFYSALQEFGLPVPEHFSEEFVLEAYRSLPRHRFLQYCDRNMFFINHSVIKQIAAQEHRQADLVVHLARLLYYKNLHSPETREQQHVEIQSEIVLFQKARQDGEVRSRTDTQSTTSESSQDQWASVRGAMEGAPVNKPMLNALLTGAVLSYYHSYIQVSPSNASEYSTATARSFASSPGVFSPQSEVSASVSSPRSELLSPLLTAERTGDMDPCTTPLNSFMASVQVESKKMRSKRQKAHVHDEHLQPQDTEGLIYVKNRSKRLALSKTPKLQHADDRNAQEKNYLTCHVKEFSRHLFSPETLSPIGPHPEVDDLTFNSSAISIDDSSEGFSSASESHSMLLSPFAGNELLSPQSVIPSPAAGDSPIVAPHEQYKDDSSTIKEGSGGGIFQQLVLDASIRKKLQNAHEAHHSTDTKAPEQEEEASEEARSIFTFTKKTSKEALSGVGE